MVEIIISQMVINYIITFLLVLAIASLSLTFSGKQNGDERQKLIRREAATTSWFVIMLYVSLVSLSNLEYLQSIIPSFISHFNVSSTIILLIGTITYFLSYYIYMNKKQ